MTAPREKISAFVVTFNEEDQIGPCLESLRFCDEILVIDSLSTDRTVAIAESLGARVVSRPWPGYVGQKAFGLSEVKNDWVLNVDADERVTRELRESIEAVLAGPDRLGHTTAAYEINRVVYHLGRFWRRGGWYPEYRTRLFRKGQVRWGGAEPHEKVIVNGSTGRLSGELEHYSFDSLVDQFRRLDHLSTIAAETEFNNGERATLADLVIRPIFRTTKFYLLKKGFYEGYAGLIVAIAEGYYTFMKYAKLWELGHPEVQHRPTVHEVKNG